MTKPEEPVQPYQLIPIQGIYNPLTEMITPETSPTHEVFMDPPTSPIPMDWDSLDLMVP